MKRVVITGQGTINALGMDVASTVAAMAAGTCAIGEMEFPNVDRLSIKIGGQVKGFEPKDHFERQQLGLYDRFTQFAVMPPTKRLRNQGWNLMANSRRPVALFWAQPAVGCKPKMKITEPCTKTAKTVCIHLLYPV